MGPELAKLNLRPLQATDNVLIIVMNLLVRPMLNSSHNRCHTVVAIHTTINKSLHVSNRCPTNSNSSTIYLTRLILLLISDRFSAVWANSWEACSRALVRRLQDLLSNDNSLVLNLANLVSNSNSGSINSSGTIVIIIMTISSSLTIWGQESIQHSRCFNKLMPSLEVLEVSILVSKWATSSSPMVSLWTDKIDQDLREDAHKTL